MYHFNSSLEHTALQPFRRWVLLVLPSMSYQIIRTCIHLHLSEVKPVRAKCIAQGHNIKTMMSQHWEKHDISLQILHQAGIGLSQLYPLYHRATSLLALEWVFFSSHHRRVVAVWYYSTSQWVVNVVLHMPTLSPRALRSCITHRRHSINTGFENAIAKETAGRKQTASVLYKERHGFRNTLQNGSFSCIWTTTYWPMCPFL